MLLFCEEWIFPAYQYLSGPLPGFSGFPGLCPSFCAPQWINCHQIPHDTGGKLTRFCYLLIMTMSLHVRGGVLGGLWPYPLDPIWSALLVVPPGEILA